MTTTENTSLVPTSLDGFSDLAERFAKSALIPSDLRAKPADVFVTLLAGHELGLSPMAALHGIHIVKGRPILRADTMVGVVLASGAAEYFRCAESTHERAIYETLRRGATEPQRREWNLADAKRAGLGGDNWAKYPRAMLGARCKAELARDVYPDVLAGCYIEGEIDDDGPTVSVGPIVAKREPLAAPTIIDADVVEVEPAAQGTASWSAFVADLAATTGWSVLDETSVICSWTALLDGRETRQDIDAAAKPVRSAIDRHRSDIRVAALRARIGDVYNARITALRTAAMGAAGHP